MLQLMGSQRVRHERVTELNCYPLTGLRMLAEDVIFLGQRQKTSYSQHSQHHEYQHFVTEVYAQNRLCHMGVPEVREPRSFIKGNRLFY